MRPFERKYSLAQREAIVRAIVDGRMSAARACKLAAQGLLEDASGESLEPFEYNVRTASEYAKRERERRRGEDHERRVKGSPEQRLDATCEQAIAIVEWNINRLDNRRKRKDHTAAEVELMRKYMELGRSARASLARVAPNRGTQPASPPTKPPAQDESERELMRRVKRELEGRNDNGSPSEDLRSIDHDS